jgi:hypothetical protein
MRPNVAFAPERVRPAVDSHRSDSKPARLEVKQFVDDSGDHQTIVPRVLGQSPAARRAKGQPPSREWTRELVLEQLAARRGPVEAAVAERILDWVADRDDLTLWSGRAARTAA